MTPVAVVTGAAGGIGMATCDLLARHDWQVIRVDRVPVDHPQALQVDISDPTATHETLASLPRVDALVNNAALQLYKPLLDTTIDEWDEIVAVNLRGAFVCLKAVSRQLVAAQGAVVNVGSVHAYATSRAMGAYAATKGGLSALSRAAAIELAPAGVRVNTVIPGAIDTAALRNGFSRQPAGERNLITRTPLGRIGETNDIAEAIAFLLDPQRSSFVTGQELVIDGGATARLSTE